MSGDLHTMFRDGRTLRCASPFVADRPFVNMDGTPYEPAWSRTNGYGIRKKRKNSRVASGPPGQGPTLCHAPQRGRLDRYADAAAAR